MFLGLFGVAKLALILVGDALVVRPCLLLRIEVDCSLTDSSCTIVVILFDFLGGGSLGAANINPFADEPNFGGLLNGSISSDVKVLFFDFLVLRLIAEDFGLFELSPGDALSILLDELSSIAL